MNKQKRSLRAKQKAKENRLIRAGLFKRDETQKQKSIELGFGLLKRLGIYERPEPIILGPTGITASAEQVK